MTVPPAAFPDDSPTPHKTEGQAVPEKSPVDSDGMQLAWASSVENLLKKPELNPKTATTNVKTFKDYAECVFVPYLKRQLVHVARVDVVWDAYKADSLKAHTREG